MDSGNIIEGCGRRQAHAAVQKNSAPRTYKQAMNSPDSELWRKAIDVELENMARHNVFTVVELNRGAKTIGITWVFKEK